MKTSETYKGYTITVDFDSCPWNPREDENSAILVFKSRDYIIGDRDDVDDYADDLLTRYVKPQDIIDYVKENRDAKREDEENGESYLVFADEYSSEEAQIEITDDRDEMARDIMPYLTRGEKLELIDNSGWFAVRRLDLYEHGNILLKASEWSARESDIFDLDCVGFALVHFGIAEDNGISPDNFREWAIEQINAELNEYNSYLNGEVFEFSIESEEDPKYLENYGGFYDEEEAIQEAKRCIDCRVLWMKEEEKKRAIFRMPHFATAAPAYLYNYIQGANAGSAYSYMA